MRKIIIIVSLISGITQLQALSVSEIMSNPVGDDSGREWIEVYNNESTPVDLSTLSISIKGGLPVGVVLLQGNSTLQVNGYAIISSIVSATSPISKFLDSSTGYPTYTGQLLRTVSSISLVNTGTTSLDIRLQGNVVDSVASYIPAGEGKTLSKIGGNFVSGVPTPGVENQASEVSQTQTSNIPQTNNQTTIVQMSAPSPDIVLYLPKEVLVVAGAEKEFSVYGMTRSGKMIDNLKATWAFGDGGQGVGTSTTYTYAYPGRYIASVEAGDGSVQGVGMIRVMVVPPELSITSFGVGKYGSYIDIDNPNTYDIELSQWKLYIGNVGFPFPKNTVLQKQSVTHISGRAMGFASTTLTNGNSIRITFPNFEEVTRFVYINATSSNLVALQATSTLHTTSKIYTKNVPVKQNFSKDVIASLSTLSTKSTLETNKQTKDTRLVSWFKDLFSK